MLIEKLLDGRRLTGLAACALGTLTLAGCAGTAHGVAGMELVDCSSGPKTNELVLKDFAKGQSFELGKNVKTIGRGEGNGDALSGPLHVLSLGGGEFSVNLGSISKEDDDYQRSSAENVGQPDAPVTVLNSGEQYVFSSQTSENGMTTLTIDASCQAGA